MTPTPKQQLYSAIKTNELLYWFEPSQRTTAGLVTEEVWFCSVHDAITLIQEQYKKRNLPIPNDYTCLIEFIIVHWAELSL